MEPTRRWWALAGLAVALAAYAVVLDAPLLLVAPAGLGAYLLAHQYRFLQAVDRLDDGLHVDQAVAPGQVPVEGTVVVTLSASTDVTTPLSCRVEAGVPLGLTGADSTDRTVTVDPGGDRSATATLRLSAPVVGPQPFDRATVRARDPLGLFKTEFAAGPAPEVTVVARSTESIHVGEGGDPVRAQIGEHVGGQLGIGFDPAGVREYQFGDAARHIDWKATARMNEPYVQEYESETDRHTLLLVDHRAAMDTGRDGRTKLDVAREVALSVIDGAARLADPLGWYTVGDEGLTGSVPAGAGSGHYDTLRRRLYDLTTTHAGADAPRGGRSPAAARAAETSLDDDESGFARTLRPYFGDRRRYVDRVAGNPLVAAARRAASDGRGTTWTVLVTDDTDRTGVREAVSTVRGRGGQVLVFLLPSALYDVDGLDDLEDAYERYADFEAFRRDLADHDRVTALEVAPEDRLSAVLDVGRSHTEVSA